MDEMKLKLSTGFMRNIISKLISTMIRKKYGCKVDILLNDLNVSFVDGETNISVSMDAKLGNEEFKKLVKSIGLD